MTVAILDDDRDILDSLAEMLADCGFAAETFDRAADFRSAWVGSRWDAALLDLNLPVDSGLKVLGELRRQWPELPIAIISGTSDVGLAVEALRAGAREFFEKPLAKRPMVEWLRRLESAGESERERHRLASDALERYRLVGESEAMAAVREKIERFADLSEPVLVHGETGTGKELVAGLLHYRSRRRGKPFSTVNAAALSETLLDSQLFGHAKGSYSGADSENPGLIRASEGGSFFLDEIGELKRESQAKLLRVLQDGMVLGVGQIRAIKTNARFILATNRHLPAEIQQGGFREDLYYRIASFSIEVPPLRERCEDIALLAGHFVRAACHEYNLPLKEIAADAFAALGAWPWPGNVRELRSVILNATINAGRATVILLRDIALGASPSGQGRTGGASLGLVDEAMPLSEANRKFERSYIERQLALHGGRVSEAAKTLGILPSNLHRKMREHGLG
ncbi:MAG: sigma-54-dependent transcriptional regulator [Rectinemataceae bacterium]